MTATETRSLAPEDAPWMAALMARRREEYQAYSPVFWRRAADVEELHATFLRGLVENPDNIALRTDRGFVTATPRGDQYYADDFALEDEATWEEDGRVFLLAAWADAERRGAAALRVVTAARDAPKVAMLRSSGMAVEQRWWVKPLRAAPGTSYSRPVEGDGYGGFLTAAPPVYDPGGPVVIINRFDDPAALARPSHAKQLGVVLVILLLGPGADAAGYEVASEFYAGRPR